ncbi:hypothetical protein BaRGS_00016531 [Batillaria attramentaria]|uniref:Uncharacterized protein n=1 Tax=Batillaria attramentaria TaxID=370345 RepID=A0ABD0KZK8_9CAEN
MSSSVGSRQQVVVFMQGHYPDRGGGQLSRDTSVSVTLDAKTDISISMDVCLLGNTRSCGMQGKQGGRKGSCNAKGTWCTWQVAESQGISGTMRMNVTS